MPNTSVLNMLCAGLLLAVATMDLAAQAPLDISPRVGDEIDSLECEYFSLFPLVQNVSRMRLFRAGDTGYTARVEFSRDNTMRDTSYALSPEDAAGLTAILENYELLDVRDQNTYEFVPTFVAIPGSTPPKPGETELVFLSGESVRARPLSVVEDGLYYTRDTTFYDWENPTTSTSFASSREIWSARSPGYWTRVKAGTFGGLVSGVVGAIAFALDEKQPVTALSILAGGGSVGAFVGDALSYNWIIAGKEDRFGDRQDRLEGMATMGYRVPPEVSASSLRGSRSDRETGRGVESSRLELHEQSSWEFRLSYNESSIERGSTEVSGRVKLVRRSIDMDVATQHTVRLDIRKRLFDRLHVAAGTALPLGLPQDSIEDLIVQERARVAVELDIPGLNRDETDGVLEVFVRPSLDVTYADVAYDLEEERDPDLNRYFDEPAWILAGHARVVARYWVQDDLFIFNSIGPSHYYPLKEIEGFGEEFSPFPPHERIESYYTFEPYIRLNALVGVAFAL